MLSRLIAAAHQCTCVHVQALYTKKLVDEGTVTSSEAAALR